jgi:hypothetical protein
MKCYICYLALLASLLQELIPQWLRLFNMIYMEWTDGDLTQLVPLASGLKNNFDPGFPGYLKVNY